eukprot:m.133078 g.133078  ORF g.133078 m.133078 type:complete len:773 (-) comp13096_c1_seq12:855-3173(-)
MTSLLMMNGRSSRGVEDEGPTPISKYPPELQEQEILADLIFILLGVEGTHIRQAQSRSSMAISYRLPVGIDVAVKRMVERILPVCKHHAIITHYLEHSPLSSNGRVNQALAEAVRAILKDYHILIVQLENQLKKGKLTLQRFQFGIQPSLTIIEKIAQIVGSVLNDNCTGGKTLSVLHKTTRDTLGLGKVHELCYQLTAKASAPYLELVRTWIDDGVVSGDGDDEFMIVIKKHQPRRSSTNKTVNCTLRDVADIPSFLVDVSEMILETGRQVQILSTFPEDAEKRTITPQLSNALAHIHTSNSNSNTHGEHYDSVREKALREKQSQKLKETLSYSLQEHAYASVVRKCYKHATKRLLDALLHQYNIIKRLESIKKYFSMEQSDVFVHFLTNAENDLRRHHNSVSVDRLSALLELSLVTSSARTDEFKDDLRCTLASTQLITELFSIIHLAHANNADSDNVDSERKFVSFPVEFADITSTHTAADLSGFDLFTLSYNISWPLSLVFDHHTLKRYQFLFRQIFSIKYVERQLSSAALSTAVVRSAKLPWMQRAFALRQKMLNFVLTLQHYMLIEVVEEHWHRFLSRVNDVDTLSALVSAHDEYIDSCLRKCMLTNRSLLKILSKILRISNVFATFLEKFVVFAESEVRLESHRHPTDTSTSRDLVARETEKLEKGYSMLMGELIETLTAVSEQENEHGLSSLVLLLNFNGFYDNKVADAELKQRERAAGRGTRSSGHNTDQLKQQQQQWQQRQQQQRQRPISLLRCMWGSERRR